MDEAATRGKSSALLAAGALYAVGAWVVLLVTRSRTDAAVATAFALVFGGWIVVVVIVLTGLVLAYGALVTTVRLRRHAASRGRLIAVAALFVAWAGWIALANTTIQSHT